MMMLKSNIGLMAAGVFLCAGVALSAQAAPVALEGATIAVLPLSSDGIPQNELAMIGEAIRRELSKTGCSVATKEQITDAFGQSGCTSPDNWFRESCVRLISHELKAPLLLQVVANSIGSMYEATLTVYGAKSGRPLWSGMYQIRGTIEDFYTQMPAMAVADMPRQFNEPKSPPAKPHVHMGAQRAAQAAAHAKGDHSQCDHVQIEDDQKQPSKVVMKISAPADNYNGIAPGIVAGGYALFTLGSPGDNQTPYSFGAHALYPTGKNSHVRLKLGLPLFHNSDLPTTSSGKGIDGYASLEHDWAWRGFSIGVGLSYMYMRWFELEGDEYLSYYYPLPTDTYYVHYEPAHAFNMTLNIRGGRPNAGFYGRLSWPLPYTLQGNEPESYFVEYSVYGVFGTRRVKGGIGVNGMYKRREATDVRLGSTVYEFETRNSSGLSYTDFDNTTTSEFMAIFPGLKIAALFGSHVVVTATLELGGTIFPRPGNQSSDSWWQPSAGLGFVYSFKKLQGANAMDGSF